MSSRGVDHDPPGSPPLDRTDVLRALVPAERRQLVSNLLDRSDPVDLEELSARLATDCDESAGSTVARSAISSAAMRLQQVHLPALASAGIVHWDEFEETVATNGSPALHDPLVGRVLEERSDAWDDVVEALADPRRRAVLAVLEGGRDTASPSELARNIATAPSQPTDPDLIEVSLRHCHLPKLDAAGLVEYDDDRVVASDHPAVDGPWFDPALIR